MYPYEEKLKAINLYFKYESYAAALNELGYPSRGALRKWVYEFKRNGDIKRNLPAAHNIHKIATNRKLFGIP